MISSDEPLERIQHQLQRFEARVSLEHASTRTALISDNMFAFTASEKTDNPLRRIKTVACSEVPVDFNLVWIGSAGLLCSQFVLSNGRRVEGVHTDDVRTPSETDINAFRLVSSSVSGRRPLSQLEFGLVDDTTDNRFQQVEVEIPNLRHIPLIHKNIDLIVGMCLGRHYIPQTKS